MLNGRLKRLCKDVDAKLMVFSFLAAALMLPWCARYSMLSPASLILQDIFVLGFSIHVSIYCEICLCIPELNLLFCRFWSEQLVWCLSSQNERFISFSGADPLGSMSSMEVNVDLLEQMDLTDVSDHEALDVFLSSVGEESSAQSPDTGWALFLMNLISCLFAFFTFIIEQTQK